MPIIEDIQLYVPKDKDLNWSFFHETRCITSLYSRLLPNFKVEKDKGIQIFCVDHLEKAAEIDTFSHIIFDYFPVYVETDVEAILALPSDKENKKQTLETVYEGMKKAAEEFNWDLSVLDGIYHTIKRSEYENLYFLLKKSSPDKKYVCNIVCHHEVSSINVYMLIKKYNGEHIKKELIFTVKNTDEQDLFSEYGFLEWKLNHKVEFADKDYKQVYRLTFLEKDKPENLIWKIEKN